MPRTRERPIEGPRSNGRRNHPSNGVNHRNNNRKKWSTGKKVGVAALAVLLALLIGATGVLASLMLRYTGEVQTEGFTPEQVSIATNPDHDFQFDKEGFLNVAIFGDDAIGDSGSRSDTIIIASVNLDTYEVRLVSVYRDTLLELEGGFLDKAAHAYAFGGSQGAVSMLNRNLDLNIQHYATIDFTAAALVVDAIGGVEIEVLSEELHWVNGLSEQMVVEGQFGPGSGFTVPAYISHPGIHHLCGVQALAYMRIRKVGNNDFRRTERQREVIQLTMEGAQGASLGTLTQIVNHVFDHLSTNFTLTEALAYARDINKYHIGETAGFPFDLTTMMLPRTGDTVIPTTLENNVIQLHEFLFGTENYIPSSTVVGISNNIMHLTGTDEGSTIDIDQEWEFTPPSPDIPWVEEEPWIPEPEVPWVPTEPEVPVEPVDPGEPEVPVEPVDPGEPEIPEETDPPDG